MKLTFPITEIFGIEIIFTDAEEKNRGIESMKIIAPFNEVITEACDENVFNL